MGLYIIGVISGIIIYAIAQKFRKTIGTLKIDTSDPEKDVYRLEIDDLDVIPKMKYIRLKVDTTSEITQD